MTAAMEQGLKSPPIDISETLALAHLDKILTSASFSASPRCREFLSFVVRESLNGRGDTIKERTIAMEVFGKDHRFEPGEDSLVRVKAREVRKRLTEFYEQHPESRFRIELPLGGYVPRFQSAKAEALPTPHAPPPLAATPLRSLSRRNLLWGTAACASVAASWPIVKFSQGPSTPLDSLWEPIFSTRTPLLISIPLLLAEDGSITERVGMGAATAISEAAQFLTGRHYPYRLRFGSELTFSQLREQPSLLLGGFSSAWTTRTTNLLRFSMIPNAGSPGGSIRDSVTGKIYGPIVTKNGFAPEDYALVCRLFDAQAGQIILVAAGITTFGTESAARFLFRPEMFARIVKGQGKDWQKKNFQALIRLSVIETTPSAPTLLVTQFW